MRKADSSGTTMSEPEPDSMQPRRLWLKRQMTRAAPPQKPQPLLNELWKRRGTTWTMPNGGSPEPTRRQQRKKTGPGNSSDKETSTTLATLTRGRQIFGATPYKGMHKTKTLRLNERKPSDRYARYWLYIE